MPILLAICSFTIAVFPGMPLSVICLYCSGKGQYYDQLHIQDAHEVGIQRKMLLRLMSII